jgi:quercetin dioxygenase-like cupin family protein
MPWLDSIAAAITLSLNWLCSIISALSLAAPAAMAVAQPYADARTHSRSSAACAASKSAAFVTAADVMAAVKQLSPTSTDDEPIRVIAAGANRIGVFVVGRPKKTGPAQSRPGGGVHVTDVEVIGPGQRGQSILGGDSRRMSAGDMVIIPAGVPHGFSEVEQPITYVVIRVDTRHVLPLK